MSIAIELLGGLAGGIAKTAISHPFKNLQTLDQIKKTSRIATAQAVAAPAASLSELYIGVEIPLFRNSIEHAGHFAFRQVIVDLLNFVGATEAAASAVLVGLLAGCPQSFVVAPLDKWQIDRVQRKPYGCLKESYRGIGGVLAKECLTGAAFLHLYTSLRKSEHLEHLPYEARGGVAGSIAAATTMTACYPLDTIRARLQASAEATVVSAIKDGQLFRGYRWAITKCVLSNFVALAAYEWARKDGARQIQEAVDALRGSQPLQLARLAWINGTAAAAPAARRELEGGAAAVRHGAAAVAAAGTPAAAVSSAAGNLD